MINAASVGGHMPLYSFGSAAILLARCFGDSMVLYICLERVEEARRDGEKRIWKLHVQNGVNLVCAIIGGWRGTALSRYRSLINGWRNRSPTIRVFHVTRPNPNYRPFFAPAQNRGLTASEQRIGFF